MRSRAHVRREDARSRGLDVSLIGSAGEEESGITEIEPESASDG
ncbi:hypothetical protein PC116_g11773 [Phytophthora cactorum]|nr:hypothetical protein PC114_g9275 [Phytophthora cactorum]KAG4240257.1 hypothetical protein PC116_g11773 [Phytophthora cactorum]